MIASAFYAVVVLSCVWAAGTAVNKRQQVWHKNTWIALAMLFIALLFLRGMGIEDWLRSSARDMLRSDGAYGGRRTFQSVTVAAILLTVGAAGFWWFYRVSKGLTGRRNIVTMAALAAGATMMSLVVLRMISLHAIDRILYGPLKLNWVGDLGSSLMVLLAGLYYVKIVRERP